MDDRNDLMRLLLDGLPPEEQGGALNAIAESNAQKAKRIGASNARDARRVHERNGMRRERRPDKDSD